MVLRFVVGFGGLIPVMMTVTLNLPLSSGSTLAPQIRELLLMLSVMKLCR